MKRIVLAGHGNFASGLYSSAKIILGEQNFVSCLDCYINQEQDVEKEISDILDSFDENDEIICLTDLFGGSVNNAFMKIIGTKDIKLITGTNLNLLICLILNIELEFDELIQMSIKEAKSGLINCNLSEGITIEDDNF